MSEAAEQTASMGIKAVEAGIAMLGSLVKGAVSMVAMTAFLAMQKGHGNKTYKDLKKKDTKVLTIPAKKLRDFARLAKQYHIQHDYYSVVNRDNLEGDCDIVVSAEHAPVVNRIAELMEVTAVESAAFEAIEQEQSEAQQIRKKQAPNKEADAPEQDAGNTLERLLGKAKENSRPEAPAFPSRTAERNGEAPSGNFSPSRKQENGNRPSVKAGLQSIVREQQEAKAVQTVRNHRPPRANQSRKPHAPQRGAAR